MLERDFQKRVSRFLKSKGATVFNFIGNAYQRDIPDLYAAHVMWTGWLELKVDKNQPTEGQTYNLMQLRRRHVQAFVLRYLNESKTLQLENPEQTWKRNFASYSNLWKFLTDV